MSTLHSLTRSVYCDPSLDAVADRLAWLHDSPDNELDEYPGIGWDDPEFLPSEDDARAVAETHGADHDAQPDPHAIEAWALPNGEYHEAEAGTEPDIDWYEAARVHGHRVALMTGSEVAR